MRVRFAAKMTSTSSAPLPSTSTLRVESVAQPSQHHPPGSWGRDVHNLLSDLLRQKLKRDDDNLFLGTLLCRCWRHPWCRYVRSDRNAGDTSRCCLDCAVYKVVHARVAPVLIKTLLLHETCAQNSGLRGDARAEQSHCCRAAATARQASVPHVFQVRPGHVGSSPLQRPAREAFRRNCRYHSVDLSHDLMTQPVGDMFQGSLMPTMFNHLWVRT